MMCSIYEINHIGTVDVDEYKEWSSGVFSSREIWTQLIDLAPNA